MNHDNVDQLADDIALLLTKYGLQAESFELTVHLITDEHDTPVIAALLRDGNAFYADHYRITLQVRR